MATFCKLYVYIQIKENDKWQQDPVNEISFYDTFFPIYTLLALYFVKLLMCKAEYDGIKLVMAISTIGFSIIGETYFDKDENNDASLVILAVPISAILFSQAAIDYYFLK